MATTRSGRSHSIQSNGYGPGHSSNRSKRQELQPIGEAYMEDTRAFTSSKRFARAFEDLLESPEAEINSITVISSEKLLTKRNRDIPVLVQELVYESKEAGGGTSSKPLDR
ncbi:hypothetical protein O181_114862 [Austropuccinia psidii MF-1]|uniref:Uncharacterized protein n=1 Tax=Austropuccinia psidii MF-1 TaxID=1389203 RepID=A0A9Q3K8E0_9BASI|nr:hypothetical protein [Austropuccinia psidii MF-1]